MIAFKLVLQLLILTYVGVLIRKRNMVDDAFSERLTNLLFAIAMPCLIFYSVRSALAFSVELLKQCAWASIMGVFVVGLSIGIGQVFFVLKHRSGYARIMRYSLSFSHYSLMGIPVITGLFGNEGMLAYSFFMIAVRIGYFALTEPLLIPPKERQQAKSASLLMKGILLNPCMVALFIGLLFWTARIPVPEVFDWCIRQFSTICTPMGLLLCGFTLGKYDFKQLLAPHFWVIPVLRCIFMPLIIFAITRIFLLFDIDPMILKIAVIYSALPIPSMTTAYVLKYDPDPRNQLEAVGASVVSVGLSAITLPMWYILMQ